MSESTPAPLDTSATVESGAGEPVRDLGALAARLLAERARITAAVVGVVTAVGSVLVITGLATSDDITNAATVTGSVLTSIGALAAVVVPLLGAQRAAGTVKAEAEVVRHGVVPVQAVAAYAPASPDQDIAVGPAVGILDAFDPDQP